MMGLTTHVLDTVRGTGAAGMQVELRCPDGALLNIVLDDGGRAVLLAALAEGAYEILFHAGEYLGSKNFYDVIPVRFIVRDASLHFHVPLILSAFGYSTYRGG
jgi:5-hydroxyisourate hydrolase